MVDEHVHHVRRLEQVHEEFRALNVFAGCPLCVGPCKRQRSPRELVSLVRRAKEREKLVPLPDPKDLTSFSLGKCSKPPGSSQRAFIAK
jgi:hypothetical protein